MINLWHMKIYCIWSIFGKWRSIAYDQSLAFEDLLHMINLWYLRSIAYDESLVLKIVAYDFCYMKIFFTYLSWCFGRWRRSLHAMPFVAGVDLQTCTVWGGAQIFSNKNHSCTLLQLSAFCISRFSRAYFWTGLGWNLCFWEEKKWKKRCCCCCCCCCVPNTQISINCCGQISLWFES